MTRVSESAGEKPEAIAWANSRLRRHGDYQRVYAGSRKQFSASMTYFVAAQPEAQASSPARVGLTAGRVIGKAVERNRIKRRMREAVRRHLLVLPPGVDVVLHPRKSVMTMNFDALEREVAAVFGKVAERFARRAPDAGKPLQRATQEDAPGDLR